MLIVREVTDRRKESEEMYCLSGMSMLTCRPSSDSSSLGEKLPLILSPTLPSIFAFEETSIIPIVLSPTLPGAFQHVSKPEQPSSPSNTTEIDPPTSTDRKRKRTDITPVKEGKQIDEVTPSKVRKSPPPPIHSTTPNSAKKSVSLNEYKKRKNASSNGPLTPTLQKTLPSEVDSPRQAHHDKSQSPSSNATKSTDKTAEAKLFTEKSQRFLTSFIVLSYG